MSDMEVRPDPIVRTALQRLPVPTHGDGFWNRLEGALDAEAGPVLADRPASLAAAAPRPEPEAVPGEAPVLELDGRRDPSLALVPPALRRPSNVLLLAVAAAAVIVVAVAGTSLLDERDATRTVTADEETAQSRAPVDALVRDGRTDPTPTTLSDSGERTSSEAVLAWVEDLGTGDGAAAWEAMGPASQAHFGSQADFEAEMSALAEGYGAWSAAEPEAVLVTPVTGVGDGTLAVVTLVGMVDQEGTRQRRADAFPVRLVDGEAVLEPFAFAGAIEVVVPAGDPASTVRSPLGAGEELVIVVPADVEAPILRLDDGDTIVCGEAEGTELTALEGTPGQRCAYLPPEGVGTGEHTLTMAFLSADGAAISAGSVLFDAA